MTVINQIHECPKCKQSLQYDWRTHHFTKLDWHKMMKHRIPKKIPEGWLTDTVTRQLSNVQCACGFASLRVRFNPISDSDMERIRKVDTAKAQGTLKSKYGKDKARYDEKGQSTQKRTPFAPLETDESDTEMQS